MRLLTLRETKIENIKTFKKMLNYARARKAKAEQKRNTPAYNLRSTKIRTHYIRVIQQCESTIEIFSKHLQEYKQKA